MTISCSQMHYFLFRRILSDNSNFGGRQKQCLQNVLLPNRSFSTSELFLGIDTNIIIPVEYLNVSFPNQFNIIVL